MAIIKQSCKYCHKTTDLTSEIDLGSSGKMLIFACGHSYIEELLDSKLGEQKKTDGETLTPEIIKSLFDQLSEAKAEYCELHDRKCIKVLSSHTGKHLFPYQRDGIVAAYKNNAKFIFADEMGLGKTIQGLGTILLNPDKLLPAIVVSKSIAKTNWLWEIMDWLNIPAQVIYKSSETPWDMFKIHIVSYDMMNRLDKIFKFSEMRPQVECPECHYRCEDGQRNLTEDSPCPECSKIKHQIGNVKQETITQDGKIITITDNRQIAERKAIIPKMVPWFDKSVGIGSSLKDQNKAAWNTIIRRCKTIILDEVHLLKNPDSQRSKALKIVSSMIPHRLPMSGTLIKNNAAEYFVPLNIVRPEKYWRYTSFCLNNVRLDPVRSVTGKIVNKYTGLINPERFLLENKDFMIRRTTDQVLPELPKLWKQQKYVELAENFQELYDKSEQDFAEWFDNASAQEIRLNILAELAKLRHQTSLSKIDFTIDLAMDHIMQTERKIAIFTHHIDSREFLADRMIEFFNKLDVEQRTSMYKDAVKVLTQGRDVQQEIEDFKNNPNAKILILSTLSHGESINLQFMSDCILHERQWNPANEDQAISGRFRRIGQESKSIICQIPVAIGTIDEYFVELVERKRAVGKEIDTGEIANYDSDFVRDLAEKIAEKGRNKWKL